MVPSRAALIWNDSVLISLELSSWWCKHGRQFQGDGAKVSGVRNSRSFHRAYNARFEL